MARKKEKRQMRITEKDKAFLQVLSKTGRCFSEDAETYFNIKKSRLNQMIHNGYIQREAIMVNRKASHCYRLTPKAIRWIGRNIPTVNKLYKPAKAGTSHDIVLFRELASKPRWQQDIAMTEKDIIGKYGTFGSFSPPDLYIPIHTRYEVETGITVTTPHEIIEVVTNNYSSAEIEAKVDYASYFLGTEKGGITFIETN
ncbi:hypothetical protein [Fusibacter tunisiensis]|uniref:Transcriptional regulator n=1 Tax=Fusibacter tunisiensis TaxID=1008308 RepID=A0ABS2MUA1_9FIRM|nr:hypothetical protein [Fusibacter tunisiensis]MBM7562847.1 hypothetical protein [Fusibacter tunisiensis]